MVVSINNEPHRSEFEVLLSDMLHTLKEESNFNPNEYLVLSGNKLEGKVLDIMEYHARNTPFEGSIKLMSGQHFPDIVANNYYGVEVKTTKSNHWKSTGSSVAEGTRVAGIERIFMLFGKICEPIDFMCRPYEECLSSVVVTHSPRYLIDTMLGKGETFFDKIEIPYDELRKQDNPIKTILDYYRKQLKPGETTWWADTGIKSKETNMVVRLWSSLSREEANYLRIKGFCLFPELLGSRQDKFSRMTLWLSTVEGVIISNIRDKYTAGGRGEIGFQGTIYEVPKIIKNLVDSIESIKLILQDIDMEYLEEYWGVSVNPTLIYQQWCDLVAAYATEITDFPLKDYLYK